MVGDIVLEYLTIHRPVEDQGRDNTVMAQAGHECGCAPVPVRRAANQSLPTPAAAMASVHVGFGPGLVNEDQTLSSETMLIVAPPPACGGDVRPVLLVGQHGFS